MEPKFDIIKRYFLWLPAAAILMVIGVLLFIFNLRPSIEFTWGMEITVDSDLEESEDEVISGLEEQLQREGFEDASVSIWEKDWYPSLLLRIEFEWDEEVDLVSDISRSFLLDEWFIVDEDDILEVAIIGPSIWDWMKRSAITALWFGLIFMAVYMLFAFSWIRHFLSPWILAGIVMFTLAFDVLIPAGAYWIFMNVNEAIQVDLIFVVAVLTIMGYSINDTIVILDRIRENISFNKNNLEEGNVNYLQLFEKSVWQTMRRSLATSFSTILVLLAMFVFWSTMIQLFAFTLFIWVLAGTFSSIFLAAPLAYTFAINKT